MKQTLFMVLLTAVGTLGVFYVGPFAGVAVYYLFAVLRPQYLWEWALPEGIPWSQYVAIVAIVGSIGLLLGLQPMNGKETPAFPGFSRVHKLLLLFGAWVIVTYITAQNHDVAWPWFQEYMKIFAMFAVAAIVVRQVREVWTLYWLATLSIIYIAYEVNVLYLFQGRLDIYHRGFGGLDNNGAALLLAMGVPLAIHAWEGLQGRMWRWLFLLSVPGILHAVLMTYSRGAMLSLLMVTPYMIWRSRRRWQGVLVMLALACLLPFLAGNEIRARFFTLEQYDADASADSRFQSWKAAVRIAHDYPIVGVGIRNANLFSYQYGADEEGRTIHSQYLQILADTGYVGLLVYLAALGGVAYTLFKARRQLRGRTDHDGRLMNGMVSGIGGALAVFCIGSSFLSLEVFELPYLLALLTGQIGLLAGAVAHEEDAVLSPLAGGPRLNQVAR